MTDQDASLTKMTESLASISRDVGLMRQDLSRLQRAVGGEPETGAKGLLYRVTEFEGMLAELDKRLDGIEEKAKIRDAMQRGIAVGLSFVGVTSVTTLIAVVRAVLESGATP